MNMQVKGKIKKMWFNFNAGYDQQLIIVVTI